MYEQCRMYWQQVKYMCQSTLKIYPKARIGSPHTLITNYVINYFWSVGNCRLILIIYTSCDILIASEIDVLPLDKAVAS